jgi:hypothetical protein
MVGAFLDRGMEPFKLRVDWTAVNADDGASVEVELDRRGHAPVVLRRFATPAEGAEFARKWLADRGFGFTCDIDTHQRLAHTHIMLFPVRAPDVTRRDALGYREKGTQRRNAARP